ncbi:MAG: hypothetical protein M1817_001233 [Caeruleum heppii]|nr:MAG: hypothetical protein M1817_001233 [Caeruleum heppii]
MAEAPAPIPSAVVLPEPLDPPPSPPPTAKRRQSSLSEQDSKRARLSIDGTHDDTHPSVPASSERRKSGQAEERKRGQRLFGALLGTLSQSSSSSAQRRRADIERKQQTKLKAQAEEYDEKKKVELEKLMTMRRREQKRWDEQSMRIRHANSLAMARFLHTSNEPRIYYKPWELLPEQTDRIKSQLKEAEATVELEEEAFRSRRREEDGEERPEEGREDMMVATNGKAEAEATQGPEGGTTDSGQGVDEPPNAETVGHDSTSGEPQTLPDATEAELSKEATDDGEGGEVVVEADEDTVIY